MKHKQLYLRINHDILEAAVEKYHFDSEPNIMFQVYRDLIHCIRPSLYYEYESDEYKSDSHSIGLFVITLGDGPDHLYRRYESEGRLSESYGIECLCLEFFREAYKQVAEIVKREQRQLLTQMVFCDVEELSSILYEFRTKDPEIPIVLNEASAMIPSKSVAFRAFTSQNTNSQMSCKTDSSSLLHDCRACNSNNCPFRTEPSSSTSK